MSDIGRLLGAQQMRVDIGTADFSRWHFIRACAPAVVGRCHSVRTRAEIGRPWSITQFVLTKICQSLLTNLHWHISIVTLADFSVLVRRCHVPRYTKTFSLVTVTVISTAEGTAYMGQGSPRGTKHGSIVLLHNVLALNRTSMRIGPRWGRKNERNPSHGASGCLAL